MSVRDAKNLKGSPLLERTLREFRQSIIEKWIDCTEAGAREKCHSSIKCIDEFAETLNDRIERELAGDDESATE